MSTTREEKLCGRMQARRAELRMSQGEVAAKAGLSKAAINHFECGRAAPRLETTAKLAEALQCSVDWLLGGKGWTEDVAVGLIERVRQESKGDIRSSGSNVLPFKRRNDEVAK